MMHCGVRIVSIQENFRDEVGYVDDRRCGNGCSVLVDNHSEAVCGLESAAAKSITDGLRKV